MDINSDPYAILWTDQQQLRKQISDLETQQNNFLAANGGYVNTENLPILSGYQEKIAELRKQLETAGQSTAAQTQESGYATLGDAYADSVFGQTGTVQNTDTVARQGGGTLGNEPLTLSAQGQTPMQLSTQNGQPMGSVVDGEAEYPSEPSPGPMPGAPPVPEDHPDMEDYEEELDQYWDEYGAWQDEVDERETEAEQLLREKGKKDVPLSLKCIVDSKEISDKLFKEYASEVLNRIESGGISGERGKYVFELGGVTAEVELLDDRRVNRYGGSGTIDQSFFEKVISEMLGSIGTVFDAMTTLGTLIDKDFNPGMILEPGDVRIRIGATYTTYGGTQNNAGPGMDYFFRDGEFLYACTEGSGNVVWGNRGDELTQEYTESGKMLEDFLERIPIVPIIEKLK